MLEYVVRPFQSPAANGAIIIASTPTASKEIAQLTWSAAPTESDKIGYTGFQIACCDEVHQEHRRDIDVVRITGNDPANWIDVERAKKLYMNKTNDTSRCQAASQRASSTHTSGFGAIGESKSADTCKLTVTLKN
jgi:hypothetical protein